MTFDRLLRPDWVAFVAALALLLVMATDWYTSAAGVEARRIEKLATPQGAFGADDAGDVKEDAKIAAENAEKTAWQADGFVDGIILVGLLMTVFLAVAAAFLRAAGRRYVPPWTPSTVMALIATATGLLLGIHIILLAGDDIGTQVKAGAPIAAILLGVIALAGVSALRAEESGKAWQKMDPPKRRPTTAEGAT